MGKVALAEPPAATLDMMIVLDAVPAPEMAAGVTVSACARSDEDCTSPLATAVTDTEGKAKLSALPMGPHGFEGYGLFTSPSLVDGIIDTSVPLIPVPGHEYAYTVYDASALYPVLKMAFGIDQDPTKGMMIIYVNDCKGGLGAGVSLTVEGAEAVVYATNGVVVPGAKATPEGGGALAINVPPGAVKVTGKLEGTEVVVGTASAHVRGGAVTTYYLLPTP